MKAAAITLAAVVGLGSGAAVASADEARPTISRSGERSDFAVGAALGHPSSVIVFKQLSNPKLAIQGGLGTGMIDGRGIHVYADLQYTVAVVSDTATTRVPLYIGGGVRYYRHSYERVSRYEEGVDSHLGVRVPFGLAVQLETKPIDLFFEGAFVVDALQTEGCNINTASPQICDHEEKFELHLAVGLRYYLGGTR